MLSSPTVGVGVWFCRSLGRGKEGKMFIALTLVPKRGCGFLEEEEEKRKKYEENTKLKFHLRLILARRKKKVIFI